MRAFNLSISGLVMAWTAILSGCDQSTWSDRQAAVVEGIRIDTVRFVPAHSRFILRDSATKILFKGYHVGYGNHPGYNCTEILEMRLAPIPASQPAAFGPKTRIRLPTGLDCPIDTAGHDTLFTYVFPTGLDSIIRLQNSLGKVQDSAKLVRGRMNQDSIKGVPSRETHVLSQRRWQFLDSTSLFRQRIYADSLGCGEFLNQGTFSKKGDMVKVRVSWVTLDSAFTPDTCRVKFHQEEIFLNPVAY